MNRIDTLFARLFLVAASLLLTFMALEVAAEFFLWNIASDDQFNKFASLNQLRDRYGDDYYSHSAADKRIGVTPHYYLGFSLMPNLEYGDNRHNSLGFRGEEIAAAKPAGVYRIAVLGGSTTYGSDVDDFRHAFPHQLQDYLRAAGHDHVEVINAGVGAYASFQNLIYLEFRVLPVQPDLVIFYQGYNDIHTRFVYPYSAYLGDNSGYMAPRISATVMPDIWEYSTLLRALGIHLGLTIPHSAFDWHVLSPASTKVQHEFTSQWRNGSYPSGLFRDASAMEILENNPPIHYERNLQNMIAIAESQDVDVLLLTFVTSTAFDHPEVASDEYIYALAQHNEITRAAAESSQARLFDLRAAFPDDPSLFVDGRHMNLAGNQARGQLVGDAVIREFLS